MPGLDYDRLDAVGLAERIAAGELSPLEAVEAAIARIEERDSQLNAVVHRSFERAREQARGELPSGPLRGVPFLLKDLHAEDAGQPCTGSSRLLADFVAPEDSELVRRYKRAGLVILGRTNTPEFGIYGVTESELRGPCRNPWDPSRTPGGSSGGAAAAVAARMVPAAQGGDGGGSIRIPAAHCGLVGLKPTRARTPLGPFAAEGWAGFVCLHALTRSVRDSALLLDVAQGPDLGAPYEVRPPARPFREEVGADPGRLRIALCTEALFGRETHPECVRAAEEAAALAEELGHEVTPAKPDFSKEALVKAYLTMVATSVAVDVRRAGELVGRTPRPSDVEKPTWLLKLIGEKLSAAEYLWERDLIHAEARRVAAFFEDYDVLLTPTAALPPL
ncbi:MAG: amidase, partial [Planctomycetota bacterium]